jgi:hypothetical protein
MINSVALMILLAGGLAATEPTSSLGHGRMHIGIVAHNTNQKRGTP